MIENMIAKLLQRAADEDTQKVFCDKELGESKATKADKEDIARLSSEVAENDAVMKTATAGRQQEKAAFMVSERDLPRVYEGASLLQTKAASKEVADAQGDGSGTLGVLEVAESDFVTGRAEARTVEQQAQAKYVRRMKDLEIRAVQATLGQETSICMHIYETAWR